MAEAFAQRTWAEIDLDRIAHNYHILRQRAGGARFLGVVKANAYGCGAIQVARKLESLGADYLAVACFDEARELREAGIALPLLILGYTPPAVTDQLLELNITQAVSSTAAAAAYSAEAVRCGKTLKIHVKIDTGMTRLGFQVRGDAFRQGVDAAAQICSLPGLEAEGIFTHMAVSDEPNADCEAYTREQFDLFMQTIEALAQQGHTFAIRHCTNSGASAYYPEMALDMVRPGIALYGAGDFAPEVGLLPVMRLKTTVYDTRICPADTTISYGRTYRTGAVTRTGVMPIGYADGLFRCLSNRMSMVTEHGSAPQIGRICMDMCMIDLTELENVQVGDTVEIFGDRQSVNELAALAGTIPYELMCAVSRRIPRFYYENGTVTECVRYL